MVAQWQAAGVFAAQAGMYKPKKEITTAWRAVPTRQLNLAAFPCAHQPRAWEATACVLAKIEVPKDMDCLFHALAFPDGGDGTALRAEVAAFMQSDAHKQIGSEEAWRREGRKLLQGTWGGRMAIAAFSLLRRVKVEVHVHQPSGNVAIMDATHESVQTDPGAPLRRIFYNGSAHHYEALLELGHGWVLPIAQPPTACTRCACACHAPRGYYDS